ncbi:predicted protein [Sclerotinia sclerotiorum 1980 UF-70]|uniref:Uncharacterized protein n=1 Tax=Sclerotinia sclerotiorum (strain ATCC 18683 / 1980 / Ss-1) TaxID=665079 RepID=A7EVY8_SCLS1|nr:predicted protein [Sclerotinia sclerotiorum 1980 UF-70]EDN93630.1 predicted protein [Sclerotinia sclerotiorum 1980 UF-70]
MQSPRIVEREPIGNLIQDDRDFKATYAYVLAARGADEDDHPAAWEDQILIPAGTHDQVIERIISVYDFFAVLVDLLLDKQGTTTNPESEINLSGQVSSARIRRGDPELGDYMDNMEYYERKIELEFLGRARDITSNMVLANIHTDDFKERCRSNFGHLRLAMLFYNLVTDDQLYFIFRTFWLAVDFSFIQCSDKLPDSPTDEDKYRRHLRKFTKLKFAHFAAYYFEQCLQQKTSYRHDSTQPSRAERQVFASGIRRDMGKEGESSKSQENENGNDAECPHYFVDPEADLD